MLFNILIYSNKRSEQKPFTFAGARHCVTKPLNVLLNSSLKLLKEHFEKYFDTIYNNSGINPFWNIDSSEKFLNNLKSCEVHILQVNDFTT